MPTERYMHNDAADLERQARRAAGLIAAADSLVITAGAGLGVDSGLPDFRGTEGFWQAYPALAHARIRFEEIASPHAFENNPELAWGFYGHRLNLYRQTVPHPGYRYLQAIAGQLEHGAFVYTSNVDGHFARAGFASEHIVECHGSIHHLQCLDNCAGEIWEATRFMPAVDTENCLLTSLLPNCPRCGALARPNILMFGDYSWEEARTGSQQMRFYEWRKSVRYPVVLEIGAGTAIPTVRMFGAAQQAPVIRINPAASEDSYHSDVYLQAGALTGITAIARELQHLVLQKKSSGNKQ